MADLSGMFGTIDSALGQVTPVPPPVTQPAAPDAGPAPAPGIRFAGPQDAPVAPMAPSSPSPTQTTINAIDAALAAPPVAPVAPTSAPAPASAPAADDKPPIPLADVPADVANSGVSGVESGFLGLLTLPRTIRDAVSRGENYLIAKAAGATGALPPGKSADELNSDLNNLDSTFANDKLDHVLLPSFDDAKGAVEKVGGEQLYQPKSVPGEYAHTVGEFIPGGGEGGLVTHVVLPAVASETAGQLTKGTGLEPYARVAGGLAGGVVGAAGLGAKEAGSIGLQALQDYRQPATVEGQQALAAQRIANATSDLPAARAALDQPSELVPGSQPTTFQQTGDLGLGQLERQQRTANPEPFIARDQDQNAARVGAMDNIQATGSPADVATRFRQLREVLDQHGQAQIDAATPVAADANAAMGGQGTAESTGAALRQPVADARAAAKDNENQLWGLVNQDAGVPAAGIAKAAQEIKNSITPSAAPLSGEEGRIFDVASKYPEMQRFGDLKDLRSSITDATAEARASGNTQTARRLSILRTALDDALDHGVENQAALEDIAVRRGVMAPAETLEARAAALREKWNIDANASRANASGSLRRTGTDSVGLAGGGSVQDSGGIRTGSSSAGRTGQAPSDQGIPKEAPAFQPEDVAAYRAATGATKDRAQTFDEGPVGKVLKPAPRGGYAMPDAAVPDALVPKGKPTDAQVVRQYVAAGGDHEALADATAYMVRKSAMQRDGTLDTVAMHRWLRSNKDALAEMPPDVSARFANAARTQETVDAATEARSQRLATFDKSALARVAGLQDGEDVTKTVASIFGKTDAINQMRTLATAAAGDPAATEGLRRAIADHMLLKMQTNGTVNGVRQIKGDTFLGFLRQNGPTLRQVFKPNELNSMAAIGADLDRANMINQTKGVKSSPGTAQDLMAGEDKSILTKAFLEAAPVVAGKALGGWPGAALGWLGAKTVARGRAAGLANIDELVTKAMLDPALAKALLAKLPTKPDQGTAGALGHQLARIAVSTAAGTYASSGS